ncbi:hypothetical protein HY214_04265 [Candidatus Roizmanbacteria bacterium]|nr:hypothetical protein [Candidatus Roizmanbacteria bacterium]
MQLPFFAKKNDRRPTFLGLFLKEESGIGLAMRQDKNAIHLLDREPFNYTNGWENICEDVDEMLIKLEGRTRANFKDTIFFVYSHFIDQHTKEIKKHNLDVIKTLVKSIELKALGYIEAYEAVAEFLERRDESPLTAIVVEMDTKFMNLFVYKGGKSVFGKSVNRSENLIADLEMVFAELKGKILLPSRMVLYNSHDLDHESTKIVTHRWSEDLFIQLPKVEIIKEDEILDGMVSLFETQIAEGKSQAVTENESETTANDNEVMGFVIGKDVAEPEDTSEPKPDEVEEAIIVEPKESLLTNLRKLFLKIKRPQLFPARFSLPILTVTGLILIVFSIFLNEYFLHTAGVQVYMPSQTIDRSVSLQASGDPTDSSFLPISIATKSATLTESAETTGQRDIGDKAKGEVTIYNLEDVVKTFKAGTTLDSGGLKFTLDIDSQAPAATVNSTTNAPIPGKIKAAVTAGNIGREYNLDKDKRFKIDDLSQTIYYAINEAAFVGGVKKQIQTVSKNDVETLKIKILNKVKTNEKSNPAPVDEGERIIEDLTESNLTDIHASKEIGQESSSVSLTATAENLYYIYKKNDLLKQLVQAVKEDIPAGFKLDSSKIDYAFTKVAKKKTAVTLTVAIKGRAMKEIETAAVVARLKGRDKKTADRIIKNEFHAQGYTLTNRKAFFGLSETLPFFSKNIKVEIASL